MRDWKIDDVYLKVFAAVIFLPSIILLTNRFFNSASIIETANTDNSQKYLLMLIPVMIFGGLLLLPRFHTSIFYFGIGIIPYAITVFVIEFNISSALKSNFESDFSWYVFLVEPFVILVAVLVLMYLRQNLEIQGNSRSDRTFGLIGLLLTVLLFIGQFLPWIRQTYTAGSGDWKFTRTGTKQIVDECCYLSSYSPSQMISAVVPILGLALFFLGRSLGYQIPSSAFIVGIFWTIQESVSFLSHLGTQDPLKTWTQSEVEKNSLTHTTDGLFGGYLFIFASVAVCVVLLMPRVIAGRGETHSASTL